MMGFSYRLYELLISSLRRLIARKLTSLAVIIGVSITISHNFAPQVVRLILKRYNDLYSFMGIFLFDIYGGAVGTGVGLAASKFFIPFMQIGEGGGSLIPPFQVLIPWDKIGQVYWLFGFHFGQFLAGSIVLLRRVNIFEAIKLGEIV